MTATFVSYPHREYWRDVGTIDAYWSANMDFLTDRRRSTWTTTLADPHPGRLPGSRLDHRHRVGEPKSRLLRGVGRR